MKKTMLPILLALLLSNYLQSQNVGIGTTTPRGPLSFPPTTGQKIILWDDGNIAGNNYGIGVQGGQLQLHTYSAVDDIVFGYGKSTAFNQRMAIKNSGDIALDLNGRITLRNGTNPLDLNYGSGLWMYKADNSALLGFMGVQNNQNLGFYGGPAGWGFTYDALNSRVGIGNSNPNAPLAFAPSLGKKITLYPGATGDVGFGVAGNRLQIYSDNPNADVAIGYDAAGTFNERFAVKANGSIAVNGNTGAAGQALTSNGNATSPTWSNATRFIYDNSFKKISTSFASVGGAGNPSKVIVPNLFQSVTVTGKVMAMVSWSFSAGSNPCAFCGDVNLFTAVKINGNISHQLMQSIGNGSNDVPSGTTIFFLDPGTYNFEIEAACFSNSIVVSVGGNGNGLTANLCVVLFPM